MPEKFVLHLNNFGGDLNIAWSFYDFIRMSGLHLITVASGNVESAAVTLFVAGKERYASQFATFLLHYPEFSAEGNLSKDTINRLKDRVLKMHDIYLKTLAHGTGLSVKKIKKISKQGKVISAKEAKEYGIAHHIF